jgi:hypothetical protein
MPLLMRPPRSPSPSVIDLNEEAMRFLHDSFWNDSDFVRLRSSFTPPPKLRSVLDKACDSLLSSHPLHVNGCFPNDKLRAALRVRRHLCFVSEQLILAQFRVFQYLVGLENEQEVPSTPPDSAIHAPMALVSSA